MRSRTQTVAATIGGLALGGLLLTGCGDAAENVTEGLIEQATDGDVDIDLDDDGGTVSIETPDGSVAAGLSTDLPDEFPDVVHVPDGLEVINAIQQDAGGKAAFVVNGVVDGDPAAVFASIQGVYDVEPTSVTEDVDFSTVRYDDIDGFAVNYTVTVNRDGNTTLSMHVSPTAG